MKMARMAANISTRRRSFRFPFSFGGTQLGNIDPAASLMAQEHRIKDGELTQPIDKLWIFGRGVRCRNRSVEAAKDLLERVVVAFAMSTGKIRITPGFGLEKRGAFHECLVRAVALPDPEFVGT